MKRIAANLALTGSFLISAAVLSPLFHVNLAGTGFGNVITLLIAPQNLSGQRDPMWDAMPIVSRATISTDLLSNIADQ